MGSECEGCANYDTEYCIICVKQDMYKTEYEKERDEFLCRLLCGKGEV